MFIMAVVKLITSKKRTAPVLMKRGKFHEFLRNTVIAMNDYVISGAI